MNWVGGTSGNAQADRRRPRAARREVPSVARPQLADLAALYIRQRELTIARLAARVAGADVYQEGAGAIVADELAALAGVARHFGEAAFGEVARHWEVRLRKAGPSELPALMRQAASELRAAA